MSSTEGLCNLAQDSRHLTALAGQEDQGHNGFIYEEPPLPPLQLAPEQVSDRGAWDPHSFLCP